IHFEVFFNMFLSKLMNIHSNGRMISVCFWSLWNNFVQSSHFGRNSLIVLLLFYLQQIHWGISHFEVFLNMFLSKLMNIHTNARMISG
ncbi:hypothetical protein MKX03_025531, partial [Papaver bracteatum]